MPQTDYAIYAQRGFEGLEPNSRHNGHNIGTQGELVNAHSDILPYGRFVKEGTSSSEIIPLSSAGDTVTGATVYRDVYEKDSSGNAGSPIRYPVVIKKSGELYMVAEEAVTPADSVFARHTANGGLDQIGRVRTDADGANALAVANAKFLDSAAAGEVVRVYMNFE